RARPDSAGHGAETVRAGHPPTLDAAPPPAGSGNTSLYVHMTCYAGFFQDPRRHSLAVATLLTDDGGAWGAWATTGQTYPADHPALNAALADAVLNEGQTLGEATRAALAVTDDTTAKQPLALLGAPSARLGPAKSPALTTPASSTPSGCTTTAGSAGLLPLLLAAAWLLYRRPSGKVPETFTP